jgi:hypothetical protein
MVTLKDYDSAFPHTYQKINYRRDSVYDVLSSATVWRSSLDVSRREEGTVVFNSLEVMMSLIVAYAYVYHLESRIIGSLSRTCSNFSAKDSRDHGHGQRDCYRRVSSLPTSSFKFVKLPKIQAFSKASRSSLPYLFPPGHHVLPRQGVILAVIPISEVSKIINLYLRFWYLSKKIHFFKLWTSGDGHFTCDHNCEENMCST